MIRQELASPSERARSARRRRAVGLADQDDELDLERALRARGDHARAGARARGVRAARSRDAPAASKRYPAGDVDVAVACAKLSRFGISPRHLRTFRTAADREAALLEQLVAPALRSRNAGAARGGAASELQTLAELAQELSQLLFWRDLQAPRRELASGSRRI